MIFHIQGPDAPDPTARQFAFRGDRLAYSNGIIILAVAATVLLAAFGGKVMRLIHFTPSVSSSFVVRHWWERLLHNTATSSAGGRSSAMTPESA